MDINIGDRWFVKFDDGHATVYCVDIVDITEKTVQFWLNHQLFRYERSFIHFIEKEN